ncbi:hypothetical protein OUZ56_005082 [Daphnia magna]|uniref:Uncharacterized protein n=1 Tax=Daphnia magna TaxID=35525 RepID=A0ABQ9YRZ3_9CRUS|nr:hypothetical protein OUZ56_005082 [Daphnia magna]
MTSLLHLYVLLKSGLFRLEWPVWETFVMSIEMEIKIEIPLWSITVSSNAYYGQNLRVHPKHRSQQEKEKIFLEGCVGESRIIKASLDARAVTEPVQPAAAVPWFGYPHPIRRGRI